MLQDVTKGAYTDHPVKIHPSYGEWKEYVPTSEDDFRKIGHKIVSSFDEAKVGIRISSVNAALNFIESGDLRVNFESNENDWVDAYWELYRNRFIYIGYSVDDKSIKQFFARPTEARRKPN